MKWWPWSSKKLFCYNQPRVVQQTAVVTLTFHINIPLHVLKEILRVQHTLWQCGSLMHNGFVFFLRVSAGHAVLHAEYLYTLLVPCSPCTSSICNQGKGKIETRDKAVSQAVYMQVRGWKEVFSLRKKPERKTICFNHLKGAYSKAMFYTYCVYQAQEHRLSHTWQIWDVFSWSHCNLRICMNNVNRPEGSGLWWRPTKYVMLKQ